MGKLFVFLPTGQLAKGENQFIKVVYSIYFLFCLPWQYLVKGVSLAVVCPQT